MFSYAQAIRLSVFFQNLPKKLSLNIKTDTADPTESYNVSEICQPTRNNDSQELTTGVYLNVINSLWHEFFNSIHPNLSSGNKKCTFLAKKQRSMQNLRAAIRTHKL